MAEKKEASDLGKVIFHYIKSPHYRVSHVDGVYGSVTPHGSVAACFFSERFPIPDEQTHALLDNNRVKELPEEIKGKKGIIREIDSVAIISPDTAQKIGEWLIARAREAESLMLGARKAQSEGDE